MRAPATPRWCRRRWSPRCGRRRPRPSRVRVGEGHRAEVGGDRRGRGRPGGAAVRGGEDDAAGAHGPAVRRRWRRPRPQGRRCERELCDTHVAPPSVVATMCRRRPRPSRPARWRRPPRQGRSCRSSSVSTRWRRRRWYEGWYRSRRPPSRRLRRRNRDRAERRWSRSSSATSTSRRRRSSPRSRRPHRRPSRRPGRDGDGVQPRRRARVAREPARGGQRAGCRHKERQTHRRRDAATGQKPPSASFRHGLRSLSGSCLANSLREATPQGEPDRPGSVRTPGNTQEPAERERPRRGNRAEATAQSHRAEATVQRRPPRVDRAEVIARERPPSSRGLIPTCPAAKVELAGRAAGRAHRHPRRPCRGVRRVAQGLAAVLRPVRHLGHPLPAHPHRRARALPAQLVFFRTAPAVLLLLPFALRAASCAARFAHWRWLLAYTAAEIALPWLLLAHAEVRLPSSTGGAAGGRRAADRRRALPARRRPRSASTVAALPASSWDSSAWPRWWAST